MQYDRAVSQNLSTDEFEKVSLPMEYIQETVVEDLLMIPDENETGFFIECDSEYLAEIKEKTQNFVHIKMKPIRSCSMTI